MRMRSISRCPTGFYVVGSSLTQPPPAQPHTTPEKADGAFRPSWWASAEQPGGADAKGRPSLAEPGSADHRPGSADHARDLEIGDPTPTQHTPEPRKDLKARRSMILRCPHDMKILLFIKSNVRTLGSPIFIWATRRFRWFMLPKCLRFVANMMPNGPFACLSVPTEVLKIGVSSA